MRFLLLPALTCLTLAALSPCEAAPPSPEQRASLAELSGANDAAWTAGNADALADQYAEEGTLKVGDTSRVGREAIRSYFRTSFARRQPHLVHVTVLEEIDMLTPRLAMADARVQVERADPGKERVILRTFRNVTLIVLEGNEWRLRSVRAFLIPG